MANVLNDDGDKIQLLNKHDKCVASCEKSSPDAAPVVIKHIVEHHHRGESHIQSNYSLRDGSSLAHNPNNPFVVPDANTEISSPVKKGGSSGVSKRRRS